MIIVTIVAMNLAVVLHMVLVDLADTQEREQLSSNVYLTTSLFIELKHSFHPLWKGSSEKSLLCEFGVRIQELMKLLNFSNCAWSKLS